MEMDFKVLSITILGIMLLFNIFGYNPPISGLLYESIGNNSVSSDGELINYGGSENPTSGIQGFSIWTIFLGILSLVGVGGVIAGFFTRTPPIEYISAPFITFFGTALIIDMTWLMTQFWSFGMPWSMIGTLTVLPLEVMLVFSMYEYWRNP